MFLAILLIEIVSDYYIVELGSYKFKNREIATSKLESLNRLVIFQLRHKETKDEEINRRMQSIVNKFYLKLLDRLPTEYPSIVLLDDEYKYGEVIIYECNRRRVMDKYYKQAYKLLNGVDLDHIYSYQYHESREATRLYIIDLIMEGMYFRDVKIILDKMREYESR